MIRSIVGGLCLLIFFSCNIETLSLTSAMDDDQQPASILSDIKFAENIEQTKYTSELTNLVRVFPRFRNVNLNRDVSKLKLAIENYVYAVKAKNKNARGKTYKEYIRSYKNIQRQAKYLNPDEKELLNRYMVRIKTNMNMLEALQNSNVGF